MKLKIFLLVLLSLLVFNNLPGQKINKKITITGKVLDVYDYPVSGAIIMIDGKNTNIHTDDKGFYKVRVKPLAKNIGIFTFSTGVYEEYINGRTTINFNLDKFVQQQIEDNGKSSGEELINIGYGTVKKKDLIDPVGKIDATDKRFDSYSNIYDMIKGQVPGVEVTGKSIKIRGANSFMGSTEPLLVVDGMVVSTIDDIMPQSVKSIEVLKGPSASIYGSRGANGVILIYLKSASDIRK